MEVGIGLPTTIPGTGRDQVLEWARRAEARGFSMLGTIDRLVYDSHEPLIALAAAAAVTERIRLGTLILIAPFRANGALLAKQAATLDALAGGRLVLGVAVGGREDDFRASGVDFHLRGRILDAMLDQWAQVWAGESFGTAGAIGPRPTGGRPALLLGGLSERAVARAARHGDGWTAGNASMEEFTRGRDRVRAGWQAAGRDGAPHTVVQPYFALGPHARAAAARTLGDYYAFAGPAAEAIVASALTDAESIRRYVEEYAAAGCDEAVFFPCDPDLGQIDLLAEALA